MPWDPFARHIPYADDRLAAAIASFEAGEIAKSTPAARVPVKATVLSEPTTPVFTPRGLATYTPTR